VARRQLLTDEERRLLLGVDPDALARHYTFTRSDQDLVAGRRGAANRLGFAVQLALLRHPGIGLAQMDEPVDALVNWLATRLEIPAVASSRRSDRPARRLPAAWPPSPGRHASARRATRPLRVRRAVGGRSVSADGRARHRVASHSSAVAGKPRSVAMWAPLLAAKGSCRNGESCDDPT
jgi:hypothetical protein